MYQLMWRDIPVMNFDTRDKTTSILHPTMVPLGISKRGEDFSMIRSFCADRMMLTNRKYCKEILSACQINDQTDIEICLAGKGLSFRDNYWMKKADSMESWKSVNLYENEFSNEIAYTALTGEIQTVHIDDRFFTGELTAHGTRAKCFIRREDGIYLAKAETKDEIVSELLSNRIALALGIHHAAYTYAKVYGKEVSLCKINTSPNREIIPAREVMKHTFSAMHMDAPYYKFFMEKDREQFLLMQLFDYLTLNTDRNRDNFALLRENGQIRGLYELYDHDSCFKGKTTEAHYFVSGLSFCDTMEALYGEYPVEMKAFRPRMENLCRVMDTKEEKEFFINAKDENTYDSFMNRTYDLFSYERENNFEYEHE